MRNIISSLLKFIMVFFVVFLLFFPIIFILYIFPFLKIKTDFILFSNLLKVVFIPAYFNSLFNSLIVSTFLYGIFVLNYLGKYRFRSVVLATLLSIFFVFVSLLIFNPDYESMEQVSIDDARLFFNEKVFFEYNYTPEVLYDKDVFEKDLLLNANSKKNRQLLLNNYWYDPSVGKYRLRRTISPSDKKAIGVLLQNIGCFEPTRFYFEKVEPKFIDHAIIIKGSTPKFCNYLNVDFLSKTIVLRDETNEKYEFYKDSLDRFFSYDDIVSSFVFKNLKYTAFNSLRFNTIYEKCLFWFSIIFFILSLCILIITPTFPLLLIIIRFFLVVFFYILSTYILQLYNNTNFYLPDSLKFIGPSIVSLIWLLLAIVVNIIRVIFFNRNSLEKNL